MKHKFTGGGLLNKRNSLKLQKFKEKNSKRKIILTAIILSILLLSGIYLYNSFAIFTEEKHFNVINGEIQDPGDIYFAYYVDGEITRSMPKQNTGYTLNKEKSECTNGVIPKWDNAGWQFIGDYSGYNATDYTRTRCNLYFENTSKVVSTALGNINVNTYIPDFSKSACDDKVCESHEKGIYETQDDDGTSYYYRGSVENNYVKFAGYYWRIIRINGKGSIRLIYDGTSAHDNGESSEDRAISTSKYNSSFKDNMYVGYMYTSGSIHGTGTDSTIKASNDSFYNSKLTEYTSYLEINAGFCNDRSIVSSAINNNPGVGTNDTIYAGYKRVVESTPSLSCLAEDYFTTKNANKGNKTLTYSIGLITVDEMLLSGYGGGSFEGPISTINQNINGYLVINKAFYSMTPVYGTYAIGDGYWSVSVFLNSISGKIDDVYPIYLGYLRPVINLKNTLKFTGDGTKNNPYVPSI